MTNYNFLSQKSGKSCCQTRARQTVRVVVAVAVDLIDVPEIDKLDHLQLDIHTPDLANPLFVAIKQKPGPSPVRKYHIY